MPVSPTDGKQPITLNNFMKRHGKVRGVQPDFGPEVTPFGDKPVDAFGGFQPKSKRRELRDIFSDIDASALSGPGLEDDSAAYDAALKSSQDQAAIFEKLGTERVLGDLQGRGLARSGIAIDDVISKVLGPSFMRQQKMAGDFGLEQARRRSALLENQRAAGRTGRLQSIFGEQEDAYGTDRDILGATTDFQRQKLGDTAAFQRQKLIGQQGLQSTDLQNQYDQRNDMLERRQRRREDREGRGLDIITKKLGFK